MTDFEVRTLPVEIRAITDDEGRTVEGRAIVYDVWSEDLGGFRERLAKGSANLDADLLALFDHDTSMVLGRTTAGTLKAWDDGAGVLMRANPPETTWANDLLVSLDRGDIRHMSFRLLVRDDHWEMGPDGLPERTILAMDVSELSVVAMPAYPQTSAEARSRATELRHASDDELEEPGGSPDTSSPGSGDSKLYRSVFAEHYRPVKGD